MKTTLRFLAPATCIIALLPAPLAAQEGRAPGVFAQPMTDDALQAVAGREDVNQQSQAELSANVANNSVGDGVKTGDALISGNAFQNMSGLSILNVNTGNNVAINAAMNVNISISPGG